MCASSSKKRMITCAAGVNNYGDRIKNVDKSNATSVCPVGDTDEDWEHAILCEKNM